MIGQRKTIRRSRQSERYDQAEVIEPAESPKPLEPLAVIGGMPTPVRTGYTSSVPEPTAALMAPPPNPASAIRNHCRPVNATRGARKTDHCPESRGSGS